MNAKSKVFVVRSNPYNVHCLPDFLEHNRVAIGWQGVPILENHPDRNKIKKVLHKNGSSFKKNPRRLGQIAGQINRFFNQMQEGDYVLVPNRNQVYIGRVISDYKSDPEKVVGGLCHYREVFWFSNKRAVEKSALDVHTVRALKCQLTCFVLSSKSVLEFIEKHIASPVMPVFKK